MRHQLLKMVTCVLLGDRNTDSTPALEESQPVCMTNGDCSFRSGQSLSLAFIDTRDASTQLVVACTVNSLTLHLLTI